MRKLLFALVIIVLLLFAVSIIYRGIDFAGREVWGVSQISEENDEIDERNDELTSLVNSTYPAVAKLLASSSEALEKAKKDYEDQAILLSNSKYYKQTEKYKVEFLWTKIGNYAKDNNITVDLKFKNSITPELYDIDIIATGKYPNVSQFIYDLENDSRLGFKIEDFNMKAAVISTDKEGKSIVSGVQGTFTCKEIRIDMKSLDGGSSTSTKTTQNTVTDEKEKTNTTTNTSEAENTTNTANTTNTEKANSGVESNTSETEQVQKVETTNEVSNSTP